MKKFAILLSCLSLVCAGGCTSKKEQLTANTLTIAVTPGSPQNVSTGNSLAYSAVCRSAKSDNVDIAPAWSVENNLGTFTPASGKSTVFNAGSASGTGKIYASYGDVRSAGVTVIIGGGGAPTSDFVIYTDLFSTQLAAPGAFQGMLGDAITLAVSTSEKSEGTQSFAATFTIMSYGWAGWFMSMPAASVKDMSAYAGGHLRFDIKTDYDIQIGIRSDNVDADANDAKKYISNYITLDGTRFQPVAIPIAQLVAAQSGTDLAQMKDLFIAAAVGRQINAQYSKTFLIDNIRWTLD